MSMVFQGAIRSVNRDLTTATYELIAQDAFDNMQLYCEAYAAADRGAASAATKIDMVCVASV